MADINSELQFKITHTGAKELSESLVDIEGNLKRTGRATSDLTRFVREQRTENRQMNFLFRESRDVIGSLTFATLSLTSATGGSNKEIQKLNQTLATGFTAFQATNFAMSALGVSTGGVATAIQLVVGGGAALLAFLESTKPKAEDAAKALEAVKNSAKDFVTGLSKEQAEKALEITRKQIELFQTGEFLGRKFQKGEPSPFFAQIQAAKLYEEALRNLIEALKQTEAEEKRRRGSQLEDIRDLLGGRGGKLGQKDLTDIFGGPPNNILGKFTPEFLAGGKIPGLRNLKAPFAEIANEMVKFTQQEEAMFAQINNFAGASANVILDFFRGTTEGIGGLFTGLLNSIISEFERLAAELAARGLFAQIASWLGFGPAGGIFKKLTGGLFSSSAPPSTGTTINVIQNFSAFNARGLRQEFARPEVRIAMTSAISDAVRKGKI